MGTSSSVARYPVLFPFFFHLLYRITATIASIINTSNGRTIAKANSAALLSVRITSYNKWTDTISLYSPVITQPSEDFRSPLEIFRRWHVLRLSKISEDHSISQRYILCWQEKLHFSQMYNLHSKPRWSQKQIEKPGCFPKETLNLILQWHGRRI